MISFIHDITYRSSLVSGQVLYRPATERLRAVADIFRDGMWRTDETSASEVVLPPLPAMLEICERWFG